MLDRTLSCCEKLSIRLSICPAWNRCSCIGSSRRTEHCVSRITFGTNTGLYWSCHEMSSWTIDMTSVTSVTHIWNFLCEYWAAMWRIIITEVYWQLSTISAFEHSLWINGLVDPKLYLSELSATTLTIMCFATLSNSPWWMVFLSHLSKDSHHRIWKYVDLCVARDWWLLQ